MFSVTMRMLVRRIIPSEIDSSISSEPKTVFKPYRSILDKHGE
jgi:hypothetical protein